MNLDYKAIGKRIKIARIRAELSQEQLSDIVDLSYSHMSNIETGTTRVSLAALVDIANALSVSLDELLCDNVIHTKPQFEAEIKSLLDDCDEYEIRVVKDLLEAIITTLHRDALLKGNTFASSPINKK